jgi:zinc transporter ZupT
MPMDSTFLQLAAFGIAAGLANVLGGFLLFPAKFRAEYKWMLRYLLALGAGFMLAVTFLEILPRTVGIWQNAAPGDEKLYIPMLLLLSGYVITQFFEHTIAPHFHTGQEPTAESVIQPRSAYAGIGGLMIHTFMDGVAIAAATQLDTKVGFLVFIAVFLHKFPEGLTIASMVLAAGQGVRQVLTATTIVGAATVLGVVVFYFAGTTLGFSAAYVLPFASGITLYVAASDLIPEVNHHGGRNPMVSISVFAGVMLFFALRLAVPDAGH